MNRKKFILIIVIFALFGFTALIVLRNLPTSSQNQPSEGYVLNAEVVECYDYGLMVKGIGNSEDIYNNLLSVGIKSNSSNDNVLDVNNNPISTKDIPIGSIVKIEFDGRVLESNPASITAKEIKVIKK